MDWNTYYEKFYDWSTSTQIKKMSSLTSFGASAEVSEVAQEYMDEKSASRLVKKAVAYGIQFTPEEIYDLSGCCDTSAMNELLKSAKTNGTQEGLSSKKSPETQQKEAQHAPFDVMLGFSSLQRFQRVKQCSVCKKHFRILPNGVKMLYAVKIHIQRRTVYALPCFAF